MDSSIVTVDTLRHFSHWHPLNLVHLRQPPHKKENVDDEDEDEVEVEDEVEFVEEDRQCNLCREQIWSFHLCYYSCKTCSYSLHKFCAELTYTLQNHPLHPGHTLQFYSGNYEYKCRICNLMKKSIPQYFCYRCDFQMDIICPTLLEQKINHHSHPHQLERILGHKNILPCVACRNNHEGVFFQCTTCPSLGKTSKNFKEDEHPNLLRCPFQDEGDNLVKCYMSNQHGLIGNSRQREGEMLSHGSHQHPLSLFDKQTSVGVSLHDPMKRTQLLCDGCVKPVMTVPVYTCCQYGNEQCCFVLHEWCARVPAEVQDYVGHPEHTLVLLHKIPGKFFGVFTCDVCRLSSNGFAYGCTKCDYYVDINCAFIPKEITHDSHPNHLLSIVKPSQERLNKHCKACKDYMHRRNLGFHCLSCDFYIDVECALLLPRIIKHKIDKHPLTLRYEPAENHIDKYFCEICEDEFSPWKWFYHCSTCAQSMHAACAPLILQCEQNTYADNYKCVYDFLNVKFGGTVEIKYHSHRLAFVQGLETDGRCRKCGRGLQYNMIFKCLEGCDFAFDYWCASSLVN
ncbi:hypothetical protein M8C21_000210 [Ambrosia artemisiifolia]|uniref:DC1 domain-containing protein n=1 Tax=Ambrosia artemisiifolia TaxID=4212 RepID=A0AAD5GFJ3_AMBAR|nr:hypothetical protein M8C21_000210 [Ambrosia artemisiifolia]